MQTASQRRENDSVIRQIAGLHQMSHDELRSLWRTLNGSDPPAYNRTFIIKRLAYRIQEIHYGGLSERAKTMMTETLRSSGYDEDGRMLGSAKKARENRRKNGMPVVGTRLIREWNGSKYEVIVVPGGFEYQGRKYRSLTAIAKAITGTHWNGRAFFGLRDNGKRGKA